MNKFLMNYLNEMENSIYKVGIKKTLLYSRNPVIIGIFVKLEIVKLS
jgi:hypothetical protein